jgi:hypothetical protein
MNTLWGIRKHGKLQTSNILLRFGKQVAHGLVQRKSTQTMG